MSNDALIVRVQVLINTSEYWTTTNPIIPYGYAAYIQNSDNNKIKIGNGVDYYNDIPFTSFASGLNYAYITEDVLENATDDLQNKINTINNNIVNIQNDIRDVETSLSNLTKVMNDLNSKITKLEGLLNISILTDTRSS